MPHEPKWLWTRWHDPLRPLVKAFAEMTEEDDAEEQEGDLLLARRSWEDDDEEDDDRVNPYHTKAKTGAVGPTIMGPLGVVPLLETNVPSKLYKFWMGETNFSLTKKIVGQIKQTPGVESLDVFTRYRFRLGVGRVFNAGDVLRAVEESVFPRPAATPVAKPVTPLDRLKRTLGKTFSHWAIIVLAEDKHEFVGGGNADEVNAKTRRYDGHKIVRSWETSIVESEPPSRPA